MFATTFGAVVLFLAAAPAVARQGPPDHQVRALAAAAVASSPQFTIFDDVSIEATGGVVTLTGKVTTPVKKEQLARRLSGVHGVREVVNQLSVLPISSADDELRQRIARAIYGNASFWHYAVMPNPSIHIIVEHSRVTLRGAVRNETDRALARALATQTGALSVTVDLKTDVEMRLAAGDATS